MRLIKVHTPEDMPKTMFTAEELSTFIRKSILVFVVVTIINGAVLMLSNWYQAKENRALKADIIANRIAAEALTGVVTTDISADQKWREEFGKANPKAVLPRVIQPTPPPVPKAKNGVVVGKTVTPPPTVIVIPSPPPVVKREVRTRTKKIFIKATPRPMFEWFKKTR